MQRFCAILPSAYRTVGQIQMYILPDFCVDWHTNGREEVSWSRTLDVSVQLENLYYYKVVKLKA